MVLTSPGKGPGALPEAGLEVQRLPKEPLRRGAAGWRVAPGVHGLGLRAALGAESCPD